MKEILENQYLLLQQGELTVNEFEQWIYATDNLEQSIGEDIYNELLIINYNTANIKSDLRKLLKDCIEVDKLQKEALINKLDSIIEEEELAVEILLEMYDLYMWGYTFLEDLGMGLGLLLIMPPMGYSANSYEKLSESEKGTLVKYLYPIAKALSLRVKDWVEKREVVLFVEEGDPIKKLRFKDYRTEEDKQSILWIAQLDPQTGDILSKKHKLLNKDGGLVDINIMHSLIAKI